MTTINYVSEAEFEQLLPVFSDVYEADRQKQLDWE